MTTLAGEHLPVVPAPSRGAMGRIARRTYDALSSDQARAVLEVRPDPVATLRRSGANPFRILCFGGGALRGVGLRDHDLGLPGRIADRIAEVNGRGVQIDVIVDREPTRPAALAGLSGLRLRRYDAVIVVLGEDGGAAPVAADQWRGAVVGLTRLLLQETCSSAGLFIYESGRAVAAASLAGRAPRNGAQAARLVEVTEEVCALTDRVRFAELRPIFGAQDASGRFSEGTYADWADVIVNRLQPTIAALDAAPEDRSPRAFRNQPQHEALRQRAVDALRIHPGDRDPQLDREVEAARSMYGMSGAAFNVIDGPLQWSKATTRDQPLVVPREAGACGFAIASDELTLINDTWLDGRTKAAPLAQGPTGIRFYAGYPVHSPDGYRVGMVCIYGTKPRSLRARELEGLRDVAARVEQHLWNDVLRGRAE
jgi:GAF domain-containing protein